MLPIEYIDLYFLNLKLITTVTGIAAFVVSFICAKCAHSALMACLGRAATWCALPSGLAFLVCSAAPGYVPRMSDASLAFLMGGLALVAIALYDIGSAWRHGQL